MMAKKQKIDSFPLGIILGLLVPVVFFFLFVLVMPGTDFESAFQMITHSVRWAIKYLFIAMVPDFICVYIFNKIERWMMCRGMIVAMMFMVIGLLIFTLIGA